MEDKDGWNTHWGSEEVVRRLSRINTAYPEVVRLLLDLTDENSQCLELGCGSGTYSIELVARGRKCLATDFSEKALELTKIKGKKLYGIEIPTQRIDIYDIPYPKDSFDLVFSDGVIEHLEIPRALKEMYRVLKSSGWMIAKVPTGTLLYKLVYYLLSPIENRPYEVWLSRKEWSKTVEESEYKNVEITNCGGILVGFAMRIPIMKDFLEFLPSIGKIYFLIKAQK